MPPKKKAAAAGKKPKVAKVNGHVLAENIAPGEIFKDSMKKEWVLGKPIGSGGFGLIYLADKAGSGPVKNTAEYVMKVEPRGNGPLFCEVNFYTRVAKSELIKQWISDQRLQWLGIPEYVASGNHEYNNNPYRFMVMQRFGTDLQKKFEENGKRFSNETTLLLALRVLDALQYMHDKEFVHADIKAANILQGYRKGCKDHIYLVDFGLATRYVTGSGDHKEYKEDPRKVHDGTIEFTSRDAHKGVAPSRRGDLEILGYCLVQWLCGALPWENKLENKEYVRDQKIKYMADIPAFMKKCFPSGLPINEIKPFLEYVSQLQYDQQPDYNKLKKLLQGALKKLGLKDQWKVPISKPKGKSSPKRSSVDQNSDDDSSPQKKTKKAKKMAFSSDSDFSSPDQKPRKLSTPKQTGTPRKTATPKKTATPRKTATPKQTATTQKTVPAKIVAKTPAMLAVEEKRALKNLTKGGNKKKLARKDLVAVATQGTQTSPGLKGLKRSRKT